MTDEEIKAMPEWDAVQDIFRRRPPPDHNIFRRRPPHDHTAVRPPTAENNWDARSCVQRGQCDIDDTNDATLLAFARACRQKGIEDLTAILDNPWA